MCLLKCTVAVLQASFSNFSASARISQISNKLDLLGFCSFVVVDVDKGNLELTINLKFCLEDNLCVYELPLFDKKVIPKPGCNWDLPYLDPSESQMSC